MMKMNKARQQVVELFIGCLNKSKIPWYQGFMPAEPSFNPITNTVYRNSNRFILYINEFVNNYKDPRWMTFNQASSKGYFIKKGSKGVPIEFWSLYDNKNRKSITSAEAKRIIEEDKERSKDITYICRVYTVFNATQMEGIPPYKNQNRNIAFDEEKYEVPLSVMNDFCENTDLTMIEDDGVNTPYYQPSEDKVVVPDRHRYMDEEAFFSDTFHEIAHSTGHAKRLKRDLKSRYEEKDYAVEELRAEIGSAFICNSLGIISKPNRDYLENSVAYVQSFLNVLNNNPNDLFKAIKDADGIANYVLDKGNFELKHKLGELCKEVIQEDKYESNSITMDQLEQSLKIKNVPCLDEEETAHIVNLWDEDKASIMGRVFYCFDGETITCVDNRDGDLFIERFEEKDALLAYMWMTDLMSSYDCYELLNKKEGDVLSGQQ